MSEKKVFVRKFSFILHTVGEPSVLDITIPEIADSKYGLFVWPCAPLLAQYVLHHKIHVKGKHVLELGCGTSLPGIIAAKFGAKVTLTDSEHFPQCIELASESCRINGVDASVVPITWGTYSPQLFNLSPVDIILGSDCFYESKDFESILATVSYILDRNPSAEFWTTYQVRSVDRTIEHLLLKWNLQCKLVELSDFTQTSSVIDLNADKQLQQNPELFEMLVVSKKTACG